MHRHMDVLSRGLRRRTGGAVAANGGVKLECMSAGASWGTVQYMVGTPACTPNSCVSIGYSALVLWAVI